MGDHCQSITTFRLHKKDHINIWHMHSQKFISHQRSMGSHFKTQAKIRQDTLNTNYSNDSKNEHANQGTRMTLQVKPQAGIPVSTYSP